MKKIIIVVLVTYLGVGVIYSMAGGYYKEKLAIGMSASMESGEIKSIVNAFVDRNRLLNLCVEGNFIGLEEIGPYLMKTPIGVLGGSDSVLQQVPGFGS